MNNNHLEIFGLVLLILNLVAFFSVKKDSSVKKIQLGYLYALFMTIICGIFMLIVFSTTWSEIVK